MATSPSPAQTNPSAAAPATENVQPGLASADAQVLQGIQTHLTVQQARLSQANRTVAALTAKYGAGDPRVTTAKASVAARATAIGRISLVRQQVATPAVAVAATDWALQGRVVTASLQPASRYTVFLVNAAKAFQPAYGFAYTDSTGYFLLTFAGGLPKSDLQLFVEVADTNANPVYLGTTPFQPVLASAVFQNIVLPAGGQPIGDPPAAIRAVALPVQAVAPATSPIPPAVNPPEKSGPAPTAS
jgi:hypothetical protein